MSCSEFTDCLVRDSTVNDRNINDVLLSFFDTLSDSVRNFGRLTDALTYTTLSVTDNYESSKSHVLTALNSLGNTADVDNALFELFILLFFS